VDQLKQQYSGRQKSQSPEENTTNKSATSSVNVITNQIQGDASVIAKLSAAVAQQVSRVYGLFKVCFYLCSGKLKNRSLLIVTVTFSCY
jgi:glycerate-2-kinase